MCQEIVLSWISVAALQPVDEQFSSGQSIKCSGHCCGLLLQWSMCQEMGLSLIGVASNNPVAANQPNAEPVGNVLWALYKLKHAPKDVRAAQASSQTPSNILFACAELRLVVKKAVIDSLLPCLPNVERQPGNMQDCSNTAWALAVAGVLQDHTLAIDMLLDQMLHLAASCHRMSTRNGKSQLNQLYQALDWWYSFTAKMHSSKAYLYD